VFVDRTGAGRIFRSFRSVRILVTGVSGYVGSLVAASLRARGHEVRGYARRAIGPAGIEVVAGDAVTGAGLAAALDGVEVAYFLIHSMEGPGSGRPGPGFGARERAAAERFAAAATRAGVRRIVYLGGPLPPGSPSPHLHSRLAVERILLEAVPDSVALRASLVIGARSRSFRLLVRLVERLPVIALPAWGAHRTAPIDERDVLAMLLAAAEADLGPADAAHRALDAAGPDVVSYRALIERIADALLVDRPSVPLGRITLTPVASAVAAAVAGEDLGLVRPLMESLESDLLPGGRPAATALTVRLHSLSAAIEHALREWEETEPLAAR
jgi:uncharacterized protein YbjT (DUF2867 family)